MAQPTVRIVGQEKLIQKLRAFGDMAEREIARANLETGFSALTDTRMKLTQSKAVDTGGLRASYHLESRGEAGQRNYWQNPAVLGDGTWEGEDGQSHPGWLHATPMTDASVLIGSNAPHAAVTEYGRRPGATPPPSDALKPWLRRHGLPENLAFVVARAIGQRGLPPRPALVPAMEDARDNHQRNLQRAVKRAAQTVSEGR